mgnify:CR=1
MHLRAKYEEKNDITLHRMAIFCNLGACEEVLPLHPRESDVHFAKLMGKSIIFLSFKLIRKHGC